MEIIEKLFRKINTIKRKPNTILIKMVQAIAPLLDDKTYLKIFFYLKVGYKLDLKNPKTFNQKLNWMKLYYRDEALSRLSDKYEVKEYVKKTIGDQFVVKNYGVWDAFDQIDFEKLPSKFVLKTTHDQGGVIVCDDKSTFDIDKARAKINKHLRQNLYYKFREWPYKNIKPRIIAEEFLVDSDKKLDDFKFFCFNCKVKIVRAHV